MLHEMLQTVYIGDFFVLNLFSSYAFDQLLEDSIKKKYQYAPGKNKLGIRSPGQKFKSELYELRYLILLKYIQRIKVCIYTK